jgi:hypothetical protein
MRTIRFGQAADRPAAGGAMGTASRFPAVPLIPEAERPDARVPGGDGS